MRTFFLVGNLKMNLLSPEEVAQYLAVHTREVKGKVLSRVEFVLCPPFLHLSRFAEIAPAKRGAQNVFWEKEGAYTGEISAAMLKAEGVEYVIIGHSERRKYFGETDAIVREKVAAALKHRLRPVACVGETREEREAGTTAEVLEREARAIFEGLSPLQAEAVVIAYEPRWAIGADVTPTAQEILQVKIILRKIISELYSATLAERVPVIYGGSVKEQLLETVCFEADMDGVLVGRESLFPYEMVKMAMRLQERAESAEAESNE